MPNDYTKTADDCNDAISSVETAYYNAQDDDMQALLDDALDKIKEVKRLAEERA